MQLWQWIIALPLASDQYYNHTWQLPEKAISWSHIFVQLELFIRSLFNSPSWYWITFCGLRYISRNYWKHGLRSWQRSSRLYSRTSFKLSVSVLVVIYKYTERYRHIQIVKVYFNGSWCHGFHVPKYVSDSTVIKIWLIESRYISSSITLRLLILVNIVMGLLLITYLAGSSV